MSERSATVRLLMLEDSDLDADLVAHQIRRLEHPVQVRRVVDRDSYVAALEEAEFDIILSDFSLPSFDGAAALALAREISPGTPFIFVSGVLGEEFAIESLKEGATDYVLKQRLERLPSAVERALNEARERQERRRAEERMGLLVAELSHRVKNTLATVVAMARLTLRQSASLEAFEIAFLSRLQALSEAHSLIFQANWGETELQTVVERALNPFRRHEDDGFRISGPAFALAPKYALTLTLMLHELATNAAKYGALSEGRGQVDVAWSLEQANGRTLVNLTWAERGGPPVQAPQRKGFGHTLIERGARYELDGEAKLSFDPAGLKLDLSFPA